MRPMRLTYFTDYAMRVLIYLAIKGEEKSSITEIAAAYHISKNHLVKVVHELGKHDLIETTRGRGGGIRLLKAAETLRIGEIVRLTEEDFQLVECFGNEHNRCVLSPVCRLRGILNEALQAYLQVLDQYTIADIVQNRKLLQEILSLPEPFK